MKISLYFKEINRKNELIRRHGEKLAHWQSLLSNMQGGGGGGSATDTQPAAAAAAAPTTTASGPEQQQMQPQQSTPHNTTVGENMHHTKFYFWSFEMSWWRKSMFGICEFDEIQPMCPGGNVTYNL